MVSFSLITRTLRLPVPDVFEPMETIHTEIGEPRVDKKQRLIGKIPHNGSVVTLPRGAIPPKVQGVVLSLKLKRNYTDFLVHCKDVAQKLGVQDWTNEFSSFRLRLVINGETHDSLPIAVQLKPRSDSSASPSASSSSSRGQRKQSNDPPVRKSRKNEKSRADETQEIEVEIEDNQRKATRTKKQKELDDVKFQNYRFQVERDENQREIRELKDENYKQKQEAAESSNRSKNLQKTIEQLQSQSQFQSQLDETNRNQNQKLQETVEHLQARLKKKSERSKQKISKLKTKLSVQREEIEKFVKNQPAAVTVAVSANPEQVQHLKDQITKLRSENRSLTQMYTESQEDQTNLEKKNEELQIQIQQSENRATEQEKCFQSEKLSIQTKSVQRIQEIEEQLRSEQSKWKHDLDGFANERVKSTAELETARKELISIQKGADDLMQEWKHQNDEICDLKQRNKDLQETNVYLQFQLNEKQNNFGDLLRTINKAAISMGFQNIGPNADVIEINDSDKDEQNGNENEEKEDCDMVVSSTGSVVDDDDDDDDDKDDSALNSARESPKRQLLPEKLRVIFDTNVKPVSLNEQLYRRVAYNSSGLDIFVINPKKWTSSAQLIWVILSNVAIVDHAWLDDPSSSFKTHLITSSFSKYLARASRFSEKTVRMKGDENKSLWESILGEEGLKMKIIRPRDEEKEDYTLHIAINAKVDLSKCLYNADAFVKHFFRLQ